MVSAADDEGFTCSPFKYRRKHPTKQLTFSVASTSPHRSCRRPIGRMSNCENRKREDGKTQRHESGLPSDMRAASTHVVAQEECSQRDHIARHAVQLVAGARTTGRDWTKVLLAYTHTEQ